MRLMKSKNLILGLVLAAGAFAQTSVPGTITSLNLAGAALDNQAAIGAAIGATQATAETRGSAERMQPEAERIRLETLRESPTAQQTAAEGKPSAGLENPAKAPEAQLADARTQVRIEHLKVLAMKARSRHPDFDETISHLNLPASRAMSEAILDSELGAEIMYWLGKHPTDCKLIGDLQPLSVVREIGRIEGTIAPLAP
jgi:hypothetical protein